jgi:hypothetical protein
MPMDDEYLPTEIVPQLNFPPQDMILSVAMGMEEPKDIASRYGYEGDDWDRLEKWKPFVDAVAKQRADLEANGWTFKALARGLTEHVFQEAYKVAAGNSATLMQKLEFVKLGAKLADMEPKANTQVASGPGFSISINFSTPKPEHKVIDITPEQIENK